MNYFKEHYNSLEEEEKAVEKFIREHPYPGYDEIRNKLPIELWAEYGTLNHEWCKMIYENLTNDNIMEEYMGKIMRRGGLTAGQANHRTMTGYTPMKNQCYPISYLNSLDTFMYLFDKGEIH